MATLSTFEAECLVSKLKRIDIDHIGDLRWMQQHEHIEKLNIECHQAAQSKHDEFAVNEILAQDKLSTLIFNLVTTEVWKEKVFPLIVDSISDELSLKTYMILYEEATLVTLLQILLYHSASLEETSSSDQNEAALLELVDYVHRKLVSIVSRKVNVDHFNANLIEQDTAKKLFLQRQHLEFTICSCCVSIIRFISEHLSKASISVMERVVNTHEFLVVLVALIEHSPWTKRTEKGMEKYNGSSRFVAVDRKSRFRLTKIEGELWLSVYNLLLDKACGNKYELNDFRRNEILKLNKHLFPQIIDQLPILKDLKRTLEELSILNINDSKSSTLNTDEKAPKLRFIEIVPEFREELLTKDFKAIAHKQLASTFDANHYDGDDRKNDMEILCRIYNNFDGLEDLLLETPICAKCGHDAEKRCSRCKSEWYCSRECQVQSWKRHKKACDAISKHRVKDHTQNATALAQKSKPFIKEVMSKQLA